MGVKIEPYIPIKDGKLLKYFLKTYLKHYLCFKPRFMLTKKHGVYCQLYIYNRKNCEQKKFDLVNEKVMLLYKNGHFINFENLANLVHKINRWSDRDKQDAKTYAKFIKTGIKKERVMELMELRNNRLELRAIFYGYLTGCE